MNLSAVFLFALSTLTLWPSCGGEHAAVIALTDPAVDDRPPGSPPELPRVAVELPADSPRVPSRVLSAGDDLQNAIDSAKPGDVIALQPGATFHGPFTLRNKSGNDWITIRSNAPNGVLPAGRRVSPSDARFMPVIEADRDSAINTDSGAHHYRFIGIEFRPQKNIFLYDVITLGNQETSADALPHHIDFERCYVHGDPNVGARRGIAMNSSQTAVLDSYLADFKENDADSQAIASWNGTGPFAIVNNYLEAAGENIMFGGADPNIPNLVPSDIEIQENLLSKPVAWRSMSWSIKNLFELKNASRVLVENNIFENNWPGAQNGYAILFTPRNQDGGSPWSMVRDVTFRFNIVRHVSSGVNMQGIDDIHPSQQTKRVSIHDNLFDDVSAVHWGGIGNWIQITSAAADITIDHNTAFQTAAVLVASGDPNPQFTFTNNIAPNNALGVAGDSYYGDPNGALRTYFPGAKFSNNVLQGGQPSNYPSGNFFPQDIKDIGFVNYAGGDYRLRPNSPYKNAGTDGKDIGADLDAIDQFPPRRRAIGAE